MGIRRGFRIWLGQPSSFVDEVQRVWPGIAGRRLRAGSTVLPPVPSRFWPGGQGVVGLRTDLVLFVWRLVPVQREEGDQGLILSYCVFYCCLRPCKLLLEMIYFCIWWLVHQQQVISIVLVLENLTISSGMWLEPTCSAKNSLLYVGSPFSCPNTVWLTWSAREKRARTVRSDNS